MVRLGATTAALVFVATGWAFGATRTLFSAPWPVTAVRCARDAQFPISKDSTFDASGTYLPDSDVVIGSYQLSSLNITPSYTILKLVHVSHANEWAKCRCSGAITRDTLNLSCLATPVGDVVLTGGFVDRGHALEAQRQSLDTKAIVFRALVTVRSAAGTSSRTVAFTSGWAGD